MYMNKPILFHNKSLLLCASLIKNISYMEIHQAENFIKCKKQYMYHMQQLFYSFIERKNKQNCP